MSGDRVLVLGGTAEARELAHALEIAGVPATTSLLAPADPAHRPPGDVRAGGFDADGGLAAWLDGHDVAAVIDATHPFAARISRSAADACEHTATPLLRLQRDGWAEQPGDRWHWVDDLEQAATASAALGTRILLTTGRRGLAAFAPIASAWFLVRCITAPDPPLPPRHTILLERGPYAVADELALLERHDVDLVVTKDSGGTHTAAKLTAARERGLPVVIVRRPAKPQVPTTGSVDAALQWARAHARRAA